MKIFNSNIKKAFASFCLITSLFVTSESATAFPIYAQQAYANPREANGRIACANCHLAQSQLKSRHHKLFYQIQSLKQW